MDSLDFISLDEQSRESLELRFSEEEIVKGLMQCRKDKTPGPDE